MREIVKQVRPSAQSFDRPVSDVEAANAETAVDLLLGETLSVPERIIVAPRAGVFNRLNGDLEMNEGHPVSRGDVIGVVQSLGRSTPIQSAFEGSLVAIVAFEGQRLRAGQPVAWLRVEGVRILQGDRVT